MDSLWIIIYHHQPNDLMLGYTECVCHPCEILCQCYRQFRCYSDKLRWQRKPRVLNWWTLWLIHSRQPTKTTIFYICFYILTVDIRHCVVSGALCCLFSSAAVDKICGDRQTAGHCVVFDRKRILVSILWFIWHLSIFWLSKPAKCLLDAI